MGTPTMQSQRDLALACPRHPFGWSEGDWPLACPRVTWLCLAEAFARHCLD